MNDLLKALSKPFHPSHVSWKPGAVKGERALALAYADLRAYMNRLDEVCGGDWSVTYEPWGENRIICKLTIAGITRSSTGESSSESERSEIGGTVAEAQAMKRACAMFGLGRYLYTLPTGWADYDPKTRQFTAQAKAKLTNMLVQHYRRSNEGEGETGEPASDTESAQTDPATGAPDDSMWEPGTPERASAKQLEELEALGKAFYGAGWAEQLPKLVKAVTTGATSNPRELLPTEATKLIKGIERKQAAAVQSNGAHA
ncbi:MAG: hypothetical protein IT328_20015 [Caldilineaceae bacterium]|nr:hypothetical protein [Caldilineaceae bacterium]